MIENKHERPPQPECSIAGWIEANYDSYTLPEDSDKMLQDLVTALGVSERTVHDSIFRKIRTRMGRLYPQFSRDQLRAFLSGAIHSGPARFSQEAEFIAKGQVNLRDHLTGKNFLLTRKGYLTSGYKPLEESPAGSNDSISDELPGALSVEEVCRELDQRPKVWYFINILERRGKVIRDEDLRLATGLSKKEWAAVSKLPEFSGCRLNIRERSRKAYTLWGSAEQLSKIRNTVDEIYIGSD